MLSGQALKEWKGKVMIYLRGDQSLRGHCGTAKAGCSVSSESGAAGKTEKNVIITKVDLAAKAGTMARAWKV